MSNEANTQDGMRLRRVRDEISNQNRKMRRGDHNGRYDTDTLHSVDTTKKRYGGDDGPEQIRGRESRTDFSHHVDPPPAA